MDKLEGWQLVCIFMIPVILGSGIFAIAILVLKRETITLLRLDNGGFLLRLIVVAFVLLITGNLTLLGKIPDSAATAIFGSTLGYVFGLSHRQQKEPATHKTTEGDENEKKPA